jgi:hypothetical protein
MFRQFLLSAAAAVAVIAAAGVAAAKSEEPVQSVKLAKSWTAAIDEAKTLVLPVVVHHHGFYCGPCWGMHASVMCNEKYIDFAGENTVEVIALQDLEKGLQENGPRAAMYDAKDENGNAVKYMVEFPGLTKDEMLALHSSKASSYNNTGGIPFTVIVDPFTEAEMQRYPGGGHAAKEIMEGVLAQRKVLNQAHGPSISRTLLTKVTAEVKRISGMVEKDGPAKAMGEIRKLEKSLAKEPESLRKRLEPVQTAAVDAATKLLDDAEAKIGAGDLPGAKKILDKFGRAFDGTDIESRVKELVAKLKG